MSGDYKAIIQCLLFASSEPLDSSELSRISGLTENNVEHYIEQLQEVFEREDLGLDIIKLDAGWQLCTRPEYAEYIEKLFPHTRRGLSQASLETLSIIAYKQPITRAEIENIRGVKVERVMQTLLNRELVTTVGKKETPGKPTLYGTTYKFLEQFNLRSLDDLPDIETFKNQQN